MKKKLVLIAMVALFATVACDKSEPNKEPEKPSISISVSPTEIAIEGKAVFTVNASETATADITIVVLADKPNVLTVPASVVIKKGEKSVTFEGVGKADGAAKVTITSTDATVKIADATVTVIKEVEVANVLKTSAPTLTYSTASGQATPTINMTLTRAVDFDIEFDINYNFDKYIWTNTESFPTGVTWSQYPVTFPAGETEHSFFLKIEQGNAGTLPLMLLSIKGSGVKDIEFKPAEYVFVVTK